MKKCYIEIFINKLDEVIMPKSKKFLLLCAIFIFAFSLTSCKNDATKPEETPILQTLEGTKWKLRGIVDVEADTLKELKPKEGVDTVPHWLNIEHCYTLIFDADFPWCVSPMFSNVTGSMVTIDFRAKFTVDYALSTIQFQLTNILTAVDIYDGDMYVKILLYEVQEFELKENELKLFYNDRKNYLLYDFKGDTLFSKYGEVIARLIDTNTVIRIDGGNKLTNKDENLNETFKNFNVTSYSYAYPQTKDEFLRAFVRIECKHNVIEFAKFLRDNYSHYFSDIQ